MTGSKLTNLIHHHHREGNRQEHQGEAVLHCPGLAGDVHCSYLDLPGEVLQAVRRPGHHHRQRKVQGLRGPVPATIPGNERLQLHHEV